MGVKFYNFKLTEDYAKVRQLFWWPFFLIIVALFFEIVGGHVSLWPAFLKFIIILAIYRSFYITLRELFYTFWSFNFFVTLYCIIGLFQSLFVFKSAAIFYLYLTTLPFLGLQIYVLTSPIYYPRVRWWEYDFRYRYDLKVKVRFSGKEYDGRLTDLRRSAGCVILFDQFDAGHIIELEVVGKIMNFNLKAEIVSKREYTVGRGLTYGVKFHFDNPSMRKDFAHFTRYWKTESLLRSKMKFREIREVSAPPSQKASL